MIKEWLNGNDPNPVNKNGRKNQKQAKINVSSKKTYFGLTSNSVILLTVSEGSGSGSKKWTKCEFKASKIIPII